MTNEDRPLLIYGAGGFAREVDWLIESSPSIDKCACFIKDDAKPNEILQDKPVYTLDEASTRYPNAQLVIGIGNPATREILVKKSLEKNLKFRAIVHDTVMIHKSTEIGTGSIICAGNLIMPNVSIGQQVQINLDCTIGHDARVGDYTTISPGVHISGNVDIGEGVFIGTGANIIQGTSESPLHIADGTIIAAGACITKPTVENGMYAGVPAVRKK